LSPSRFIPLFKNSSGVSPHNYYNALLVLKARRLIQLEGSTTKEAAYALGFKNVSHFCTLFHQLAGSTPTMDHRLSPVKAEALHAFTNFPQR
jgi:AraC family transcriptional regulator